MNRPQIGWWARESRAIAPALAVVELAAEAIEIDAVMRLCESLLADSSWDVAGEGATVAETAPDANGAQIAVVRSQAGLTLVRRPEGGELTLSSRAALGLLVETFPAARRKLEAPGFGLIQHGG